MSDKVYVGNKCATLRKGKEYAPFSRVTMWYDDEHYFTAGDDTGRELKLECPWATQAIVDKILNQVKGYVYRPFEATGAVMDMAAELGDGITIGGMYSVIGSMTEHLDALGTVDVSAPGEKEIDHEFPFLTPQERALTRRVELGKKYQGVSITRVNGLTIVEVQEDGSEGAKVVLNSKELSFYDAASNRVLFFDPGSGTYKFTGVMNVNDKFLVDKDGNVTMKGNINLSDGIVYYGDNIPNKKRYAASMSGPWHDTMQSGDIYCCDWDYNAKDWMKPYKFVGTDGSNGSDASVNRANIERALAYAKSLGSSFMAVDSVGSPIIYGGKIFSSEIYAGGAMGSGGIVGTGSVISLTDDGIQMSNESNGTNLEITSELVPGIGAVTTLSNQSSPLLLTAGSIMVGMGLGTSRATGFEITERGTEVAGPVHFSGEVTGIHATFA